MRLVFRILDNNFSKDFNIIKKSKNKDTAVLYYSSGTTSNPKIIEIFSLRNDRITKKYGQGTIYQQKNKSFMHFTICPYIGFKIQHQASSLCW